MRHDSPTCLHVQVLSPELATFISMGRNRLALTLPLLTDHGPTSAAYSGPRVSFTTSCHLSMQHTWSCNGIDTNQEHLLVGWSRSKEMQAGCTQINSSGGNINTQCSPATFHSKQGAFPTHRSAFMQLQACYGAAASQLPTHCHALHAPSS